MASTVRLSFSLLLVLLSADLIVSVDPPPFSPSPAPQSVADSPISLPPSVDTGASAHTPVIPAPSPEIPSPSSSIPSPSPDTASPPAPPSSDHAAPGSSPSSSPTPSPSHASDINHEGSIDSGEETEGSSSGLSGVQKAGIVMGVIVGVGLVGLGAIVYKKRRDNMRRSEYGYAARRSFL